MLRVLIVDEMHESILPMLSSISVNFEYLPNIQKDEILLKIYHFDGLIIRSKCKIDAEFLEKAPNLKFIARAGAGLDLIDLLEAKKRKIEVFAANEANKVAVAEHVLAMLLALMNHVVRANLQVKTGIWKREENRGTELNGKTVGIIGYGNNGSTTAKLFAAFGCKVLVYDKYKTGFSEGRIIEADMQAIYKEVDIFSLHIPLSAETKKMVDENYLKQFNNPIYFINASRGEIVVLADLVKALQNNKLKGACLDVLENEKINQLTENQKLWFNYLQNAENVILMPHVAGWTFESYFKINEVLVEKIKGFIANL